MLKQIKDDHEDRTGDAATALRPLIVGWLIDRPVPHLRRDLLDACGRFTEAAYLGRDLAFAMETELECLRLEGRGKVYDRGILPEPIDPFRRERHALQVAVKRALRWKASGGYTAKGLLGLARLERSGAPTEASLGEVPTGWYDHVAMRAHAGRLAQIARSARRLADEQRGTRGRRRGGLAELRTSARAAGAGMGGLAKEIARMGLHEDAGLSEDEAVAKWLGRLKSASRTR